MKMTMHIDEATLAEVMKITGVPSKTEAVAFALTEMVRKHKLKEFGKRGLGLTPKELQDVWEDPFSEKSLRVAEDAPDHRARKRPRR